MKFNPINSNFVFEQITTADKNIQNYFMKSEQSFYTPESLKYPSYPLQDPAIQTLILGGFFIINGNKTDQVYILNSRMNILKHKSIQKCTDGIYSIIYNELKTQPAENIKNRTVPARLIISNFLGRCDIISLVDIILNQLGFKTIMILPVSICLSLHLNQNYAAFVYNSRFHLLMIFIQLIHVL